MRIVFICLLTVLSLHVSAGDYVDDINTVTTKNEAGHRVIYEMNVGSFTQAGTFAAAQEKLSGLKALGVDIIWLMPIFPRGSSKSPYAVMDYESVNTAYGTASDLKNFVDAAHQNGMLVILDWVPNHTAKEHPWYMSHPSWYSGAQSYSDVRDLKYGATASEGNSEMIAEMNRIMKQWIDRCDIDGFRFDYVVNVRPSYWRDTNAELKSYATEKGKSELILLAEIDTNDNQRWSNRTNNIGFTHDYAWWLQETVLENGYGKNYDVGTLKTNLQRFVEDSQALGLSRTLYLTNHDQNWNDGGATLTSMYGEDRYLLTTLIFSLYGTPLIYNGQETGGNQKLDYFNDTKIDWTTKDDKMRNTIRTLAALKHVVPATDDHAVVNWVTLSPSNDNVIAYTRKSGDSEVLVMINLSSNAESATLTGLSSGGWSLWLDSETIAQGATRSQYTLASTQTFSLDAKGFRVYVKDVETGVKMIPLQKDLKGYTYSLSGRRVSPSRPGIYIQNGRKLVVK